jgi:hypothetical protein
MRADLNFGGSFLAVALSAHIHPGGDWLEQHHRAFLRRWPFPTIRIVWNPGPDWVPASWRWARMHVASMQESRPRFRQAGLTCFAPFVLRDLLGVSIHAAGVLLKRHGKDWIPYTLGNARAPA